jgi:hypothetical protein
MGLTTDLLQQMLSADQAAGEAAAPQPQQIGSLAQSMAQHMVADLQPEDAQWFLTRSDVLSRPIVNPITNQTFVPDNAEALKKQLKDNLKELSVVSGQEALKAEFFLLPGLLGAGLDFIKESGLANDPWGRAMTYALDAPFTVAEALSGQENLPAKAFESYGRTYSKMIDLEAELAITSEKLAEEMAAHPVNQSIAGKAALGAAVGGNLGMNIGVGLANSPGLIAHGIAGGIRLTTRGLLAVGTAYVGRKGMMKMMQEGASTPGGRSAFGKLMNTLTGIGRVPPTQAPTEAMETAGRIARSMESAKDPNANGAVPLLSDIETSKPLATRHELAP